MADDPQEPTRTTAGGGTDGLEDRSGRGPDRHDPYYADEISLRELYLILKRGLPLITVIAMLAAAVGFVWVAVQPNTYRAEATVLNTPPAVRIQEPSVREGDAQNGTLTFEPTNTVTFETYSAIASSQAVFDDVTTALGDESGPSSSDLRASTAVERLSGPASPSQIAPLAVLHTVEWRDPEEAVRIANTWAEATVVALRASLLESVEPIRKTTAATVASRRAALDEAVQAMREFESRDRAVALRASLDGLTAELTQVERRLSDLGTLVSVQRVRVDTLEAQLDELRASVASADPLSSANSDGSVPPDTMLEASSLRAQHRAAFTRLAELEAERPARSEQLQSIRSDMERIRTDLSRLDRERAELAQDHEQATEAYRSVAKLQPQIEYLTDLAPSGVQVIDRAALPLQPTGQSALPLTLLALVVGGMVGTLFVFLREAVRE